MYIQTSNRYQLYPPILNNDLTSSLPLLCTHSGHSIIWEAGRGNQISSPVMVTEKSAHFFLLVAVLVLSASAVRLSPETSGRNHHLAMKSVLFWLALPWPGSLSCSRQCAAVLVLMVLLLPMMPSNSAVYVSLETSGGNHHLAMKSSFSWVAFWTWATRTGALRDDT